MGAATALPRSAPYIRPLGRGVLARRGVRRVYGLCGGHIQPIWDEVARSGIQIVDVRHESAAVYMAQAQADLTGSLGVAMVTAGPGLTNAATGIANASVPRSPVLVISGRPPRPQAGMGALQDIPQGDLVRPICRRVEVVSERHHAAAAGGYSTAARALVLRPARPTSTFPRTCSERSSRTRMDDRLFEPHVPEKPVPSQDSISRAAALIRGASGSS